MGLPSTSRTPVSGKGGEGEAKKGMKPGLKSECRCHPRHPQPYHQVGKGDSARNIWVWTAFSGHVGDVSRPSG